jgi:hypothetical protein
MGILGPESAVEPRNVFWANALCPGCYTPFLEPFGVVSRAEDIDQGRTRRCVIIFAFLGVRIF